jgi:hypothetical protein
MKNLKELVTEIAKREGLKSQVTVGNIREIVSVMSDLLHEQLMADDRPNILELLSSLGYRRSKKKKK